MRNILVVKLRYIGDVLLATPVLRALRERYPEAHLVMAVNRGTEDILKRNPDVDEVLVVERSGFVAQWRFLREIRRRRFDCVIDLTDGDRAAILARFSGAPVRVGLNEEHRWRGLLYTSVARSGPTATHRIERDLETVRSLGIQPKSSLPVLRTSDEDDQNAARLLDEIAGEPLSKGSRMLIIFQPGARYWFKAWPVERFADLANRLTERDGCRILIGGHAQERMLADQIAARTRSKPVVLVGRTTVLQYAAILKRCALFIGNDNGPMHMAAALGVPVVALFGPSNPAEWGPRGERVEVFYKGLDCRQCFHPTCTRGENNCMQLISIEEVYAAASRLAVRASSGQQSR